MKFSRYLHLGLTLVLLCVTGCTKQEDSGEDSGDSPRESGPTGAFATECGTVINGSLQNPASAGDGFKTPIKVIGANLLSVTLPTGPLLVKLHGLGSPSNKTTAAAAMSALESLAGEEGIFIPADSECSATLSGNQTGALGQIFTASGKSYSEHLINRGLSTLASDPCGGQLLSSCYRALQEETRKKLAGEIGRLLWKPVSDSDGRLAIHTKPYGTTVTVNGEVGTNRGGGNGYGSLARFSKSGCGYGNSVQVQVFNSEGAAYTFNGSTTVTIPSGCSRTCLEGSSLAQCSK